MADVAGRGRTSSWLKGWLALSFAVVAILVFIPSASPDETASTLSVIEAEEMSSAPSGSSSADGAPFEDAVASGGGGLLLVQNAVVSEGFTGAASGITVRARGEQCDGAPRMVVRVDGTVVVDEQVNSGTWRDYGAEYPIPEGPHVVTVAYANDYATPSCDRNLRLDEVNFVPRSAASAPGSPRMVFAHYMLCCPGISPTVEGFKEEIQMAQAAGIDGFALNAGAWAAEPHYAERAAKMYEAASQLGTGFELFFSADMCCSLREGDIKEMVTRYQDHPNQLKVRGESFLSTFAGEATTFGYASAAEGWQEAVLRPLANANAPVYFVPHFYDKPFYPAHPSTEDVESIYDEFPFVDGLFYFQGFAGGSAGAARVVASNRAYAEVSEDRGKVAMAVVSPNYSPHVSNNNTIAGDVAGGAGIQQMWRGIINDDPQYVEIVTWNDYNERSYVGPVGGPSAAKPQADAAGFPHEAYLELSEYYIRWYKTGVEPPISEDKLFYFYRTHSKDAETPDPDSDDLGLAKPANWNSARDEIYVTAMLKEPATIRIVSGGVGERIDLPAGISDISVPFREGQQRVEALRDGEKILESVGTMPISDSISTYNFNYYSGFAEGP